MISVVLPVHDDAKTGWIPRILDRFAEVPGFELVCVDSSGDGTSELLSARGVRALRLETRLRAERLQAGIDAAKGDVLLLHHPRSLIAADGLRHLLENSGKLAWGGFTHRFDWEHPLLRFTSWYSNEIRAARKGIVYLDHCVFFRRELLRRPIPAVEIFEDTELSLILRESGRPDILPFASTTSAHRFRTNGVLKQAWLNQRLKLEYFFGAPHQEMNERYERGLRLNG